MPNRLTNEMFIKKAIQKHGNKYNYFKVVYNGMNNKVIITCLIHGDFFQTPRSHLYGGYNSAGGGCLKCQNEKLSKIFSSTSKEFINKAKKVHGNKYDYSKVVYKNNKDKVLITCKSHGDFLQNASNHLSGKGCKKCQNKKLSKSMVLTQQEFINKSIQTHGNKYNYFKAIYINAKENVIIICNIHGEFLQSPHHHIAGIGCPKCGIIKYSSARIKTNEIFIKQAKVIHKNKYNYSKVDYKNSNKNIIIICKKHGEFKQTPSNHLCGKGCKICGESKGEKSIAIFLDKYKINYIREAKFSMCKKKRHLPFDFYLPNQNICIEYDGAQHFKESNGWFNKITPINDAFKTKFCRDNSINLIRISYKDFNRIEQILSERLNINQVQLRGIL